MFKLKKIAVALKRFYQPDLRALALMRIAVSLIVMVDLVIRWGDISAHYTDEGCWPSNIIFHQGWKLGYWSFHALYGNLNWQILLFSLHLLFAIFLLLGYKTRLNTLLLFVFYISLHNRNLFIQQSGDDLLRIVLLWGLFLPWSAHYSVDYKYKTQRPKYPFFSGLGYYLLISSVYAFSVLLKYGEDWHEHGTAVYYALSLEQLRLPIGDLLYRQAALLPVLTKLVLYTEIIIPLLILWPSKNNKLRSLAFVLILFLHIGFGLTLYVGLFYIISITTALGLLSQKWINALESKFGLVKKKLIVSTKDKLFLPIQNLICILILVISMIVNLSSLPWFPYRLNNGLSIFSSTVRLDQYWGMFSPGVLRLDGWYVYHGSDSIGRQWDLRLNQDYVDYKKPAHIVSMYKTDRWRKLAENMQDDRFSFLRPLYCKYILKKWNREHPEKKIDVLNLYYMRKENLADYKTTIAEKHLLSVCNEE